jgi:hypothetical protein
MVWFWLICDFFLPERRGRKAGQNQSGENQGASRAGKRFQSFHDFCFIESPTQPTGPTAFMVHLDLRLLNNCDGDSLLWKRDNTMGLRSKSAEA